MNVEQNIEVLWQRYAALEHRYDELLKQFALLEKRLAVTEEAMQKLSELEAKQKIVFGKLDR